MQFSFSRSMCDWSKGWPTRGAQQEWASSRVQYSTACFLLHQAGRLWNFWDRETDQDQDTRHCPSLRDPRHWQVKRQRGCRASFRVQDLGQKCCQKSATSPRMSISTRQKPESTMHILKGFQFGLQYATVSLPLLTDGTVRIMRCRLIFAPRKPVWRQT